MKTFKLYSLQMLLDEGEGVYLKNIPLDDGLIVNKEVDGQSWLIDAVVSTKYKDLFERLSEKQEQILIEVVITNESNFPATMTATIRQMTTLSKQISVLFTGSLAVRKDQIVNTILKQIVREGYSGEELLTEFTKRTSVEGVTTVLKERLYKQLQQTGSLDIDAVFEESALPSKQSLQKNND
ncbi:YwpF-like family protein [Desertibacillus haloalkaliphilus]|uniref:YwpF-like family protein n=1 Tax=Desertibacillus haloalkaliphilus TaxID=1328930 RepID=UPI001C2531D0|nr:YwpF-like family protein [Desertibacillus haloalkaliphilus]MBU8905296.1 YwpF-like family protein [Desertibacillus haloalkaliphilus]